MTLLTCHDPEDEIEAERISDDTPEPAHTL
jgi:hypothetical protein